VLNIKKEGFDICRCTGLKLPLTLLRHGIFIYLVLAVLGCHRDRSSGSSTANSPTVSLTTAFSYSSEITPWNGLPYFQAWHQIEPRQTGGHILLRSTGDDPNFILQVSPTSGSRWLFQIGIGSPIETHLEVFYQVGDSAFSPEHMLRFPLKIGRNKVLFELDEPGFTGALRVDPGEKAAAYSIYSITVSSPNPVRFVRRTRSQNELARFFQRPAQNNSPGRQESNDQLLFIKKPSEQASIQPLKDVVLKPGLDGLEIDATGEDPSCLLPGFDLKTGAIAKIVIVSPRPTALQVFYKVRDQIEYDQAHSYTEPINAGENTIYFEHADPDAVGRLRLDPGMEPGKYLLKELEFRTPPESLPAEHYSP
jgi:hypothetical protein